MVPRGGRLVALLITSIVVLAPVRAVLAQDGSTEPSVPELIVPGTPDLTTVPAVPDSGPLETAPPTSTPAVVADAGSGDEGLAASTKVWIIIGGLVGVALLVLILTILYWRRTRPVPAEAPPPPPPPAPEPAVEPAPEPAPEPAAEAPPPVGEPPSDPRRSVFAPPPGDEPDADV